MGIVSHAPHLIFALFESGINRAGQGDWPPNAVSLTFGLQSTEDLVKLNTFEGGTWSDAANGEFKLTLSC